MERKDQAGLRVGSDSDLPSPPWVPVGRGTRTVRVCLISSRRMKVMIWEIRPFPSRSRHLSIWHLPTGRGKEGRVRTTWGEPPNLYLDLGGPCTVAVESGEPRLFFPKRPERSWRGSGAGTGQAGPGAGGRACESRGEFSSNITRDSHLQSQDIVRKHRLKLSRE